MHFAIWCIWWNKQHLINLVNCVYSYLMQNKWNNSEAQETWHQGYDGSSWQPTAKMVLICTACHVLYLICHRRNDFTGTRGWRRLRKTSKCVKKDVRECDLSGINSLWPSDAIWWQGSGSTLVQVMAWCLTAPSHYLNQCWLIIT